MKKITDTLLDALTGKAASAERLRVNHNFHEGGHDTLQRMLNAIEPGTYIRPHLHQNPDKREAFICLRGRFMVVEYNHDGSISDFIVLDATSGNYGCEIAAGRYHSIISLSSGTVAYELKDGPYDPSTDKKFAPWAPEEGSAEATAFIAKVLEHTGTTYLLQ
ncbi:MAG TPA: WbuC family cupin fold metalloprotein [Bacteroidales bacterium]|nr:WbuC family cupin fold metalloprotein [Bacteroidales bacterium]